MQARGERQMRVTREGGEWKKKKRLFPLMDNIQIN